MKKLVKMAIFVVALLPPVLAHGWSAGYIGAGGASLSGSGYDSKSTFFLRFTLFDLQKERYSLLFSVSGTPSSDVKYGDVRILGFCGLKYFQIGTGALGGTLDATPRDTWFDIGFPPVQGAVLLDPSGKLRTTAGGIPVAVRLIPLNSEKTLLRLTAYYTVWGTGSAKIPVSVLGLRQYGSAYVKTNHGKGRYMGVELDCFREISGHLMAGFTAFWTKGKAYDLKYKDEVFNFASGQAPDTDFKRFGGILTIGCKF